MKSYEVYTCRRKALRITRKQLADYVGVDVSLIESFEKGEYIEYNVMKEIHETIRYLYNRMDSVEHYRTRILELGIILRDETNTTHALEEISHMMVELGKLQVELIGTPPKTKEDWEA